MNHSIEFVGTGVNLLPDSHRATIITRRVLRGWGWTGGILSLALLIVAGTLIMGRVAGEQSRNERESAQARLALARADATNAKKQREVLEERVKAAEVVGYHPDWSVALRLISRSRPQDLVLSRLQIAPRQGTPRDATHLVTLSGLAPTIRAVNEFTVTLEGLGPFSNVRLLDTTQEAGGTGVLIRFTLTCELGADRAGDTP